MPDNYIAILVATFLGAVVSGFSGFAFSAVAGAILLRFTPPHVAVPLMMMCSILTQGLSIARLRQKLEWSKSLPLLTGGFVGIPAAVYLFEKVDPQSFRVGFGVFLILYSSYMLLRPAVAWLRREAGAIASTIVGFAGGLVGGLTAMPGALPTIWCDLRGVPKDVQRATVQPFIAVMQAFALVLLSLRPGGMSETVLANVLLCFPTVIVGTLVGVVLFGRVQELLFRKVVLGLLLISGFGLLT